MKTLILSSKPIVLWLLLIVVCSCEKVATDIPNGSSPQYSSARLSPEIALATSYEIETITFRKAEGEFDKKFEDFYRVKGVPLVTRDQVEVRFLKNGTTEMDIEHLDPTIRILSGKDNIPPDDSRKAKYVSVKNGRANLIDKDKKSIAQSDFPTPTIADISALFGLKEGGKPISPSERIDKLVKRGDVVTEVSPGILSIKSRINTSEFTNAANEHTKQFESISLIDIVNGVILKNTLLGPDGKPFMKTSFRHRFDEGKKNAILEFVHTEAKKVDNNGVLVNTITDTYFRNMKITYNQ